MAYYRGLLIEASEKRREGVSSADSDALATFKAAVDAIDLSERNASAFHLVGVFTNTGATIGISPVYFDEDDNLIGMGEEVTLTATDTQFDATPEYISRAEFVANLGWAKVRPKITTAISTGTMDLYMPILVDDYA